MRDGNANEFIETLYGGCDITFVFMGVKYMIQGWWEDGQYVLSLDQLYPKTDNIGIWKYVAKTAKECVEAFEKALIFNGKSFWRVENEIQWVD